MQHINEYYEQQPADCETFRTHLNEKSREHTLKTEIELTNSYGNEFKMKGEEKMKLIFHQILPMR